MSSRYATPIAILLLIFILSLLLYLPQLPSYEHFHRDEDSWIAVSIFSFRSYFVDRNFSAPGWSHSFGTFGVHNPTVGKYIMGASLWLHGYHTFRGVDRWHSDQSLEWHIEQDIAPSPEELYAARLPIVTLTAATATLLALLIYLLKSDRLGLLGGVIGAGFYLLHDVTVELGRRASTDTPAIFFTILTLVLAQVGYTSFVNQKWRRGLIFSLLSGLAAGLALSTKLNAGLIWLVLFVAAIIYMIRWRNRYAVTYLALVTIIPVLVFLASNPVLWQNWQVGLGSMVKLSQIVHDRRDLIPQAALFTPGQRLVALYNIGIQATSILVLSLAGVTVLAREWRKSIPVFLWVVFTLGGTILWVPLSWKHYYLPTVPVVSLLATYGILALLLILSHYENMDRLSDIKRFFPNVSLAAHQRNKSVEHDPGK